MKKKIDNITVLFVLFNTPKKFLKNFLNYKNFKILILDQSNDLKTKNFLTSKLPHIKYYGLTNQNKGFAKAQNFLIKKVKTKYFFSSQADIVIKQNSILELSKMLVQNKKCIISIPSINMKSKIKKDIVIKNDFIGAAFLSEKKKFMKFGMFDEDFFFYWEDVDLSDRIKKSKFMIIQNFKAKAVHKSGNSTYKNFKSEYIRKVNFRYGEYLYLFKYNKLRILKITREIFSNIFSLILNLVFFKIRDAEKNFFNLIGILKFLKFIIQKINNIIK